MSDPHEVVRSGQVVRVKVVDVDVERQRIGLSLRLNDTPQQTRGKRADQRGATRRDTGKQQQSRRKLDHGKDSGRREPSQGTGSMAEALRKAGFGAP